MRSAGAAQRQYAAVSAMRAARAATACAISGATRASVGRANTPKASSSKSDSSVSSTDDVSVSSTLASNALGESGYATGEDVSSQPGGGTNTQALCFTQSSLPPASGTKGHSPNLSITSSRSAASPLCRVTSQNDSIHFRVGALSGPTQPAKTGAPDNLPGCMETGSDRGRSASKSPTVNSRVAVAALNPGCEKSWCSVV
mmetsp:Transcript_2292/g.8808  ORF Transcript_2292/g.8808 Transcript_2292/m.8808 type:complete len:200 (-) Transcript_2292:8787-9386(-)